MTSFGDYIRSLRNERMLSLRDVCKTTGYDPSNWSKMERGILPPPSDESTLKSWAKALEIKHDSEKFSNFMDLAVMASGTIPEDVLSNEKAAEYIPAFFRTIRGQKPSKEELDRLFELLKNAR